MTNNVIRASGVAVEGGHNGIYSVRFWWRLDQGRHQEEHYTGLSWTESVDAIIAELDGHRPGWAIGDGWRQPDLDSELDQPWG